MEGLGNPYRNSFAEKIKDTPKEERLDILEETKKTPEYQVARGEKIQAGEEEEPIDGGLGVLLKRRTLYHGSGTTGIAQFNAAEEDTVGNGAYFTSKAKDAIGYARGRARGREGASPVIYESSVENMRLADLRKSENVRKILEGFRAVLEDKLEKPIPARWRIDEYFYQKLITRAIATIDSAEIHNGNLSELTRNTGPWFTEYVKSLGYEGLITFEGGEGDYVGSHDSYVIFDPEKAKIIREQEIQDLGHST